MLSVCRVFYNPIRPHLPKKLTVANGVVIRHRPFLDLTDVNPHYEASLIEQMENGIQEGDTVVVVGGGKGVSTVHASRLAGQTGDVHTYEAVRGQIDAINETLELNYTLAPVTLHHATVGSVDSWSAERFGQSEGSVNIPPHELPDADVLVLDCEGAEKQIIPHIAGSIRSVVVETHGWLGSDRSTIRESLIDQGFDIQGESVEDAGKGIHVLSAIRVDD